jgi:hypothetical protein
VRDSLDEAQILQTVVQELGMGLSLMGCNTGIYNAAQTQVAIDYEYHQDGYRARIRNHGHSCFLCEIVIRSQFHTTYEPEA